MSVDICAPTVDQQLSDLETISLSELMDAAALQTRIDRKYLLPQDVAADLVRVAANDGARVLMIDGIREFGYLSDYFDTPNRELYRAAATHRRRRFKLRTRVYLDSGLHYLEVNEVWARPQRQGQAGP